MAIAPYDDFYDYSPIGHSNLGYRVISDIFSNEYIAQNTGMVYGKTLIIDTLRAVFREDRFYRYLSDVFGFPLTPSEYGLDPATGLIDGNTTRIFIGSTFRYDIKYLPALVVKNTSLRYVPISFNQNFMGIVYRDEILRDGYGNITQIYTPAFNTLAGAWDQTIEVKIVAQDEADREELTDIVTTVLMGPRRLELQEAGLFIRNISTTGEIEEPYSNDYIYMSSINLECRSEWKVQVPINDIVEKIGFCFDFGYPGTTPPTANFNYNDVLDLNVLIPDG